MEKKILFGTLGGAITGTVVSMAYYMGIFGSMAEQWMADNSACLKDMNPTWWFVGAILQGLLFALLFHKMGINTTKSGAFAGGWIAFLIAAFIGISMASTYTAYPWSWLHYDLLGNTISSSAAGAVIGWIYSRVK
ncbi:MAG: hypothetical protein IPM42_20480 [Saprospiraceae bacterium]|nr:hypothetical protein [Saprospiraceae bacterium]